MAGIGGDRLSEESGFVGGEKNFGVLGIRQGVGDKWD